MINDDLHLQQRSLVDGIQCLIESAEQPLNEYQLIQDLNKQGWSLSTDSMDSLALFTSHFLVFNALYQLQEHYWQQNKAYLEISALTIQLHPSENSRNSSQQALHTFTLQAFNSDSELRDYYLDFSHLEKATEDSVEQLLKQFWARFIATDDSSEALRIFSLEHPTDLKTVKQRYRSLAMKHHPDRGGEAALFQQINWAFGVLQRVYS